MVRKEVYTILNVLGLRYLHVFFESWCWRLHGAHRIISFANFFYDLSWKMRMIWKHFYACVSCFTLVLFNILFTSARRLRETAKLYQTGKIHQ